MSLKYNKNKIETFTIPETSEELREAIDGFMMDYRTISPSVTYFEMLHYHEFYEMEFLCEGNPEHRLNGRAFRVRPGYLCLLKKFDCHTYHLEYDEKMSLYWVAFHENCLSPVMIQRLLNCHTNTDCYLDEEDTELILTLFKTMHKAFLENKPDFSVVRESCLNLILNVIFKYSSENGVGSETNHRLKKAILYLEENFSDSSLSLLRISEAVGVSANYLGKLFQTDLNVSYNNYLCERRLSHALHLLRQGNMTLEQIAESCGFGSTSYFISLFKKRYGKTPKKYMEDI